MQRFHHGIHPNAGTDPICTQALPRCHPPLEEITLTFHTPKLAQFAVGLDRYPACPVLVSWIVPGLTSHQRAWAIAYTAKPMDGISALPCMEVGSGRFHWMSRPPSSSLPPHPISPHITPVPLYPIPLRTSITPEVAPPERTLVNCLQCLRRHPIPRGRLLRLPSFHSLPSTTNLTCVVLPPK